MSVDLYVEHIFLRESSWVNVPADLTDYVMDNTYFVYTCPISEYEGLKYDPKLIFFKFDMISCMIRQVHISFPLLTFHC